MATAMQSDLAACSHPDEIQTLGSALQKQRGRVGIKSIQWLAIRTQSRAEKKLPCTDRKRVSVAVDRARISVERIETSGPYTIYTDLQCTTFLHNARKQITAPYRRRKQAHDLFAARYY